MSEAERLARVALADRLAHVAARSREVTRFTMPDGRRVEHDGARWGLWRVGRWSSWYWVRQKDCLTADEALYAWATTVAS